MESPTKGVSGKKNFLIKTWKRCRSIPRSGTKKVAPEGFFPVYVGPEKQRFAVKMKHVNHPLFQMLLEDSEIEYGYNTPGPILLPCELDLFYKVVAEMEAKDIVPNGCGFGYTPCSLFSPSRRRAGNGGEQMSQGYGGYGVLTPLRVVKMS
ncbi:small auxin-up RNA [Artemisia annua]|uniref:Small auxin-up RNA n=1 Tax=Artemisia annua TaxID=35608 RepID=A0A2U1KUQ9_ARTAN|nr:small auxin-up RNA [Artemisia annua]